MKQKMPALFIGHGSPMNALADNPYSRSLQALAKKIPLPRAILCISAHWMTEGSWVTRMPQPKTIHDFYGFPQKLFEVQYPAPGSPAMADEIIQTVKNPKVHPDNEMWGLDHGTWSVLRHMYPEANVPVLQLSLNLEQPAEYHYQLGQELKVLREKDILLLGSGNIVHNLRKILWESQAPAYGWAIEFDSWVKEKLDAGDHQALVHHSLDSEAGRLSIPTTEHWLPLLYILGAADPSEKLTYEYTGMENGSISMRSVSFGV